jgi:hypothetical protein
VFCLVLFLFLLLFRTSSMIYLFASISLRFSLLAQVVVVVTAAASFKTHYKFLCSRLTWLYSREFSSFFLAVILFLFMLFLCYAHFPSTAVQRNIGILSDQFQSPSFFRCYFTSVSSVRYSSFFLCARLSLNSENSTTQIITIIAPCV